MISKYVKNGLMVLSLSVAFVSQTFASESVKEIANQVQVKQRMVEFLQNRIVRHQTMTLEQIREELRTNLEKNQADVTRAGKSNSELDLAFEKGLISINSLEDKEVLIAQEQVNLQNLMSSKNIVFFLTRCLVHDMQKTDGAGVFAGTILLFFTIPLDFVFLPITFLGSLFTGF